MWFTEPIKVGLSTFEARHEAGKQIDLHDLRADEKQTGAGPFVAAGRSFGGHL